MSQRRDFTYMYIQSQMIGKTKRIQLQAKINKGVKLMFQSPTCNLRPLPYFFPEPTGRIVIFNILNKKIAFKIQPAGAIFGNAPFYCFHDFNFMAGL